MATIPNTPPYEPGYVWSWSGSEWVSVPNTSLTWVPPPPIIPEGYISTWNGNEFVITETPPNLLSPLEAAKIYLDTVSWIVQNPTILALYPVDQQAQITSDTANAMAILTTYSSELVAPEYP